MHETPAERALAEIVDYAAECGLTAADIDQDAALLRERLASLLVLEEISANVALAVAGGVWALQGALLSDEALSAQHERIAAASNMTIVWVNQILQGARAAETVAELMKDTAQ